MIIIIVSTDGARDGRALIKKVPQSSGFTRFIRHHAL